jgi:hypothetical protein
MDKAGKKRKIETDDNQIRSHPVFEDKQEVKKFKEENKQRIVNKKAKRVDKKQKFVEKINPKPVPKVKGNRKKKERLLMDNVNEALENIEKRQNSQKMSMQEITQKEVEQLTGIFNIPDFQKDPVGIIQNHLKNTVARKLTKDLINAPKKLAGEKRKREDDE